MWEKIGKALDWAGRLQLLAVMVVSLPAVYVAVATTLEGMQAHEILLFTSATLALCMCALYHGKQLLGWWGERKERGRVLAFLRQRQAAGDARILLALVSTAWHGQEPNNDSVIDSLLWNAKFRQLKRAITEGKLTGTLRDNMASDADVADLIRFFGSRID